MDDRTLGAPADDSRSSWQRQAGPGDVTIEENWLFRLRRERYVSRTSGKAHDYFVMDLADAVNVIAVTPEDEVLLVRIFLSPRCSFCPS